MTKNWGAQCLTTSGRLLDEMARSCCPLQDLATGHKDIFFPFKSNSGELTFPWADTDTTE